MPRSERDKMLAGELYDASDAELTALRRRARALTRELAEVAPGDRAAHRAVLARLLGEVGADGFIEPPFRCDYGVNLHVGRNFYMNFDCVVLDCGRVDIGDDVLCGPGVHIYAATHPLDADERAAGPELTRPVRIGSKVWLGGRVIVLPGVSIGEGTTVGAGSVVTRDLPPHVVAAGNPCRVVRTLR